jgi:GT2 family glycosyltransferase
MTSGMSISVIICAYTENRWHELLAAVASIQAQSLPALEIIVVIDHNPALLERVVREIPGVMTIENREQQGLSGARNSGIAAAAGEIVAFMDEDATAAPDWLEQLSAGYAHPEVMGTGGAIQPLWLAGRPGWFPDEFDWIVGCTYRGMPETAKPIRNLIGCNMSFRREVFRQIGGFRNGIGRLGTRPLGCEETELCIRLKQHMPEAVLLYEPAATVLHRVPAIRSNWNYFRSRCYAEGLSKAAVARFVGARDGLASERTHVLKTLPQGAWRDLTDVIRHGDTAGIGRATAIFMGLFITAVGYLVGRWSTWTASQEAPTALLPVENLKR